MKRVRNSGGHAPVLRHELVERLDCLGVTQDDGNLPSLGAQGRLALGAGLGCGHELAVHVAEGVGFGARDPQAVAGRVAIDLKHGGVRRDVRQPVDRREVGPNSGQNIAKQPFDSREGRDLLGEVAVAGEGLHLCLRVGPIPTMCPSYSVTSDESTAVRREAA